MDATALLIEARLFASRDSSRHEENGSDGTKPGEPPTDGLIRTVYAAAFSRFVTGFCDSRQTSHYKQTMYEVAARIGMPVTFVDLRHECAHADPPSRLRLELSVNQALEWMWEIYWSGLDEYGSGEATSSGNEHDFYTEDDETNGDGILDNGSARHVAKRQQLQESIRSVLKRYFTTPKDVVSAMRHGPRSEARRPAARIVESTYKELMRLCGRKKSRLRTLQAVLVETRLMVSSTDSFQDNIDAAIQLWDRLVAKFIRLQPAFLSTFAIIMLAALTKASNYSASSSSNCNYSGAADIPSPLPSPSPSTVEELYAWLSRTLTSQLYSRSLDAGTSSRDMSKIHERIVSECLLAPTPATVRLAHDLVRCNAPPFQRIWAPAVNACLPLLQEWESGPNRISGNGSNVKQLEVLDVPSFPELIDIDNDNGDENDNSNTPNELHNQNQKAHEQADPHNNAQQAQQDAEKYETLALSGWKMWTGQWKSTPIGVVAN